MKSTAIINVGRKYCEWDVVANALLIPPATQRNLKEHGRKEHGPEWAKMLDARIKRAKQFGSSYFLHTPEDVQKIRADIKTTIRRQARARARASQRATAGATRQHPRQ
jgi:hypothetical protein